MYMKWYRRVKNYCQVWRFYFIVNYTAQMFWKLQTSKFKRLRKNFSNRCKSVENVIGDFNYLHVRDAIHLSNKELKSLACIKECNQFWFEVYKSPIDLNFTESLRESIGCIKNGPNVLWKHLARFLPRRRSKDDKTMRRKVKASVFRHKPML